MPDPSSVRVPVAVTTVAPSSLTSKDNAKFDISGAVESYATSTPRLAVWVSPSAPETVI